MLKKNLNLLIVSPVGTTSLLLSLFFVFLFNINSSQAASYYLSPASGSYKVGQSFSVTIYAASPGEAINAVSGTFNADSGKLEITNVSSANTKVSLWVQEPNFSTATGNTSFEGIILNPGYSGSGAKIITLNLKAKNSGIATIKFLGGSILANDGQGTNVLAGGGSASFNIAPAESAPEPIKPGVDTTKPNEETATQTNEDEIIIKSDTHPDPDSWVANKNAELFWQLPDNTRTVYLLLDKKPDSEPIIAYTPPITEKTITDLDDGLWYLHLYYRTTGGRSETIHRPIKIDTQAPRISQLELVTNEDYGPSRQGFKIVADDEISGLDYYEVSIDGQPPIRVNDVSSGFYLTETLASGQHLANFRIFDRAGNYQDRSLEFKLPEIATPVELEIVKKGAATLEINNYQSQNRLLKTIIFILILIIILLVIIIIHLYQSRPKTQVQRLVRKTRNRLKSLPKKYSPPQRRYR